MNSLGDRFWDIIDATVSPDYDAQLESLGTALSKLSGDELIAFEADFRRASLGAYRWDLWGAAYVINGGCSDDGLSISVVGSLRRVRMSTIALCPIPKAWQITLSKLSRSLKSSRMCRLRCLKQRRMQTGQARQPLSPLSQRESAGKKTIWIGSFPG